MLARPPQAVQRSPVTMPLAATDSIIVRRAVRAEIPEIAELVDAALARFRVAVPDLPLHLYRAQSRDVAKRWDMGAVLVAHQHGRLVGTVTYYPEAGLGLPTDWAGFGTLAVDPAMHRRGIGSILVRHCVAIAAEVSPAIGIHTGSFMQPARRMYGAMGFVRMPSHDRLASDLLCFDPGKGDIEVLAYRLDLPD